MKIRKQFSDSAAFDTLIYLILTAAIIFALFPLWYVVIASLSDPAEIIMGNVTLVPIKFNVESYKRVFANGSIWQGYLNSIIYTFIGTCINVILTILLAYPLSNNKFFGKKLFIGIVMFTMFFNGGMIPTYLVVRNLGILDTMWAVILPTAVSTWNMLIMKSFFQNNIPEEIIEAAKIDGASHIRTLSSVVLPISKSIIVVMILFYGVIHWNSYFDALIYLQTKSKFPLQLILRDLLLQTKAAMGDAVSEGIRDQMLAYEGIQYAVIIVSSLPLLVLYPFVQKFFEKGVTIGAVKG